MVEKIEQIVGDMNKLRELMAGFQQYKETIETALTEMGKTVEYLGETIKKIQPEKIQEQFMDIRAKMEGMEGDIRQTINNEVTEKLDNMGKSMEAVTNSMNQLKDSNDQIIKESAEVGEQVREALTFKRGLQTFLKTILGGK